MSQYTQGLSTYQQSVSYDASATNIPPTGSNVGQAYVMAGEPTSAVNETYRNMLQMFFSLMQSNDTAAGDKAQNAIDLVRLMSQWRQSVATGSDYLNGFGTEPFIASQTMVQTMDFLAIQMASSGLTPAKIIQWAKDTGVPIGSVVNPTSYVDIQNALSVVSASIASNPSALSTTTATVHPDLSFGVWQTGMSISSNKDLVLTQIRATYPIMSGPLDTGDGTGAALQTRYDALDIDPGLVSTYNQLIADINAVVTAHNNENPSTLTRADVNRVVNDMALLRTLAGGVQVVDTYRGGTRLARLSSPMLEAVDNLSRSLNAVGLVTSSTSDLTAALPVPTSGIDPALAHFQAWITPATGTDGITSQSIAAVGIQAAQTAGATSGSMQAMVEIQYVNAGATMLEKQLQELNQALVAVQTTAQLLGTLQQIHNYVDVTAPVPLALQAYSYLETPEDKSKYIGLVKQAIFDLLTGDEKTQIATTFGLDPASFKASDITSAMYSGIPLVTDGAGLLAGASSIKTNFTTYKNALKAALDAYNATNDEQVVITAIFNAQETLINQLSELAYKTLPNANLTGTTLKDPPVVLPSQINALRAYINSLLVGPIDAYGDANALHIAPLSFTYYPPAALPVNTTYQLGDAGYTTPPQAYSYYEQRPTNPELPGFGTVGSVTFPSYITQAVDTVDSMLANISVLFKVNVNTQIADPLNDNQYTPNMLTSSGQTTYPDPAILGLIGNIQWNATDVSLGQTLNAAAGGANISSVIAAINSAFNNFASYVNPSTPFGADPSNGSLYVIGKANLLNAINTQIQNLVNSGALTVDQQLALKSSIDSYFYPDDLITTNLQSVLNVSITSSYPSNDEGFRASLRQITDQFRRDWIDSTLAIPHGGLYLGFGAGPAADKLVISITALVNQYIPTPTTESTTYLTNLSNAMANVKIGVLSNTGGYVATPIAFQAHDQANALRIFLLQDYTGTPNPVGIEGILAKRVTWTPTGDRLALTTDTLTAMGLPSIPDFNSQTEIVKIYNTLSNAQRKIFIQDLVNVRTTFFESNPYAEAIHFLKGPTALYPDIALPITSAAVTNGTYIPIPADLFATYYKNNISKSVDTPILKETDMVGPRLSTTNFDDLAQQIYSMTIPPFVKLPSGSTMDIVLAKMLQTRAQLAQQLAGLELAQKQQQSATGGNSSTAIVDYVKTVLKDLERIPDPTSSTYSASIAKSALTSWILDGMQFNANASDPAIQAAAVAAGGVQTNLQTAITAATNLNGTQQQTFQKYMTVYSEFMQSASAILTAMMQILRAMITGIRG